MIEFYLNEVEKISMKNKYLKWYLSIIENASSRFQINPNVKPEQNRRMAQHQLGKIDAHHIMPRSLNESFANDVFNFVYLSKREHILVHQLLTKMLDGNNAEKMLFAYRRIIRRHKVKLTNKQAAILKQNILPANKNKIAITDGINTKYHDKSKTIQDGWKEGYGSEYLQNRKHINDSIHKRFYKISNIVTQEEIVVDDLKNWAKVMSIPYTTLTSAERCNNIVRKQYVLTKM